VALSAVGRLLNAAETFVLVKVGLVLAGKSLVVYLGSKVTLAQKAMAITPKTLWIWVSATQILTKVTLAFAGRALTIIEAFVLGAVSMTSTGKQFFTNAVFRMARAATTTTGKALRTSETYLLTTVSMAHTGASIAFNELCRLGAVAVTTTGKNLTVVQNFVVSLAKVAVAVSGKSVYLNEAFKLVLVGLILGGKIIGIDYADILKKYGLIGLGVSLDLDKEDD